MAEVYIKLNNEGFNSLNVANKEEFEGRKNRENPGIFLYPYELIQYQPFAEDLWYEIKLGNSDQKDTIIELFNGVETDGKLANGNVLPDGKIRGGSYVQEKDAKGNIITKFITTSKIKSNHKVLI